MQGVGAQFEETAELAGRGGGPEGELLHEGAGLRVDQLLELVVKRREGGVGGDGMKRSVIAMITLVFPNMN
jgi:hypothetical protein